MRKIVFALAVLVLASVMLTPARANGICQVTAYAPIRSVSTGSITYKATMSCGVTLHAFIYAEASLMRRSPLGSWTEVDYTANSDKNVTKVSARDGFPWLCSKDYRVVGGGVAKDYTGGGVHTDADQSGILFHTC